MQIALLINGLLLQSELFPSDAVAFAGYPIKIEPDFKAHFPADFEYPNPFPVDPLHSAVPQL